MLWVTIIKLIITYIESSNGYIIIVAINFLFHFVTSLYNIFLIHVNLTIDLTLLSELKKINLILNLIIRLRTYCIRHIQEVKTHLFSSNSSLSMLTSLIIHYILNVNIVNISTLSRSLLIIL